MEVNREALAQRFAQLDDEVLRQRLASGDMTPLAMEVAAEELRRRGLIAVDRRNTTGRNVSAEPAVTNAERLGDVVCLTRIRDLMEAQVLCARLEAEGIPAVAGDAELIRANSFLTQALGGIRVMVHEANLARARDVWAALQRGDYALDQNESEDVDDDTAATTRD
jgi:hypothetical protein